MQTGLDEGPLLSLHGWHLCFSADKLGPSLTLLPRSWLSPRPPRAEQEAASAPVFLGPGHTPHHIQHVKIPHILW